MEGYDAKKFKYFEMVKEPEFNELSRAEQEKVIGCDRQTLWRWSKEVDWNQVREEAKKKYSQDAPKVFEAIVKKAVKGDGKSQELYLEYFLGWSPKQNLEVTRGDRALDSKGTFELMKELFQGLSPEQKAELLKEGGAGAIEANVERLEGGGEGGPNV
jgi:hypothetical protein